MRLESLFPPAALAMTENISKGVATPFRFAMTAFLRRRVKIYYALINKLRTK